MIAFRIREVRPVLFRVIGPSDTAPPLRLPVVGPVAAIIGPAGTAPAYVHTQASPSADWIVNHNLGLRPTITVLSPGGVEVDAAPIHVSDNQVRVYFASPQSGSARCT